MPRSSLFLLIGAAILGIVAVVVARFYLMSAPAPLASAAPAPPPPTLAKAVVAVKPIAAGSKIDAAALRLAEFPVATIPQGSYPRVADAVGPGDRIAQRTIVPNEIVLAKSVTGTGARLSASGLIAPGKRAVTLKISDVAGVAGLIVPGDRVDVMITRPTTGDKPQMFTDLLVQNVRVLAIDQDSNDAMDKPKVGQTATIEVAVAQAQKVILGQTVGTVSLMLRPASDLAPQPPRAIRLADLSDRGRASVRHVRRSSGSPGTKIEVVRAVEPKTYVLPRG